jgi:N-acetylglucosaminyldiphosphoundecaprenol N-acetyl-beta-D-mannosaminyltransferase
VDGLEKIELLKIPINIIPPEKVEEIAYKLLSEKKPASIVLLSYFDLLKARSAGEYRDFVLNASLVIPISKSIISGAKFLKLTPPIRYMPFDFIVNLLTSLEKREQSVYLLGGKPAALLKTEKNIRQTFPSLRVIGRYPGYYKKQNEQTIITMIRKSTPSLLLVGQGVHGREKWLAHNNEKLGRGIHLWCSDIFDVFAERRKYPSRALFNLGLEWAGYFIQKPVRFFRVFPFLYYNILLLITRIAQKGKS